MPYIDKSERERATTAPRTPGELNFAITMLIDGYLAAKGLSYTHANDCLGALEGAKLEFYRRVVVPYEEQKKAQNGDVYTRSEQKTGKRRIEVWCTGYRATGEHGLAHRLGVVEAESLDAAVQCLVDQMPETDRRYFKRHADGTWSMWGCAILDNEAEARKPYG